MGKQFLNVLYYFLKKKKKKKIPLSLDIKLQSVMKVIRSCASRMQHVIAVVAFISYNDFENHESN